MAVASALAEIVIMHLIGSTPIHWAWWPAIGGLFFGIGGYFQPRALGVGYDISVIF